MDIPNLKQKARGITEKVILDLINDSKYDISDAEWTLWVSFRSKNKTLCLSPTIIHDKLDNLRFFHLPLFYYIKEAIRREYWDLESIKDFQISSCIKNHKNQLLPEHKHTFKP